MSTATSSPTLKPSMQIKSLFSLAVLCFVFLSQSASSAEPLKALIIDGQNNHSAWPQTTMMTKKYLEDSGRFTVDIYRSRYTWKAATCSRSIRSTMAKTTRISKTPNRIRIQAKIRELRRRDQQLRVEGRTVPEETQKSFQDYVAGGGGLVIIHAGGQLVRILVGIQSHDRTRGLGRPKPKNPGPTFITTPMASSFAMSLPDAAVHMGRSTNTKLSPGCRSTRIVKGLPGAWLHTSDELYQQLRGSRREHDDPRDGIRRPQISGSGNHEPMLMTIDYQKGRIFHTPMGHDVTSFSCVGFITTLLRGTEWAATGEVTITQVPEDFPKPLESSARSFE